MSRLTLLGKILLIFVIITNEKSAAIEDWEAWPLDKLEQEVSPSRWSPRKSSDEVIKEYVDTSIQGTLIAQNSVPHELDISYGSSPKQKYDIYGSDLPPDAPIYVWIHGGFWQEGSKDISGMFAPELYGKGMRTIVLGYTLAPSASVKEIEAEIAQAVNHITSKFPEARVTVGGHSAGATLAALLLHNDLLESPGRIQGLHLVSGFYDLRPLIKTYVNGPLRLSTTTADASSPLRIRKISDKFPESMKISIVVGKYDTSLFQQQSQEYYKLLRKHFTGTEFWKSEDDDHFTIVLNTAKEESDSGKQFLQFVDEVKESSSSPRRLGNAALLSFIAILLLFFAK